jgi:CHAT domain-containing protein
MELFYKNYLEVEDANMALKKAQLKVRETYSEPFYWAGFTLLE